MIRNVLAAVDGSCRAAEVLQTAAEVAEQFGARLHVVRGVTVPPEFPAGAAQPEPDRLPALLERAAMEEMRSLVANEAPASGARLLVRRGGQPWRMILESADEVDADLIVLGCHGYDVLDRILGTTVGKVANVSRRNVLVVHPRAKRSLPR